MLTTAVCLRAPANISHLSRHSLCVCARVMITFINFVFSGIPSYTSRAHIWSWWLSQTLTFAFVSWWKSFLTAARCWFFWSHVALPVCVCLSPFLFPPPSVCLSGCVYLSVRLAFSGTIRSAARSALRSASLAWAAAAISAQPAARVCTSWREETTASAPVLTASTWTWASHTSSRSRKPHILIGCWIWDLMWLFSRRLHHVPEMQRELQEMHVCEHLHRMPDWSQVIQPIHLLHVFLGQYVKYSQNLGLKLLILSYGLCWAVKIKPRWLNAELSLETSCYTWCSSWVQMYVEILSLVSDFAWAFPTPFWRSIKRWKKQREKRKTGHGTKSGVMRSSCSVNGFEIFSEYT